jgi:hypothetical protein
MVYTSFCICTDNSALCTRQVQLSRFQCNAATRSVTSLGFSSWHPVCQQAIKHSCNVQDTSNESSSWRLVSTNLNVLSTVKHFLPFRNKVMPSSTGSSCPFLDCLTLNVKILWPFETLNQCTAPHPKTPEYLAIPVWKTEIARSLLCVKVYELSTKYYCLWHCATSQKVAGSIPDGVFRIFYWHNSSGRTTALGLTQPLKKMNTRIIS